MKRKSFNENDLILIENNLPKHSLEDFEVGMIVNLRSGSPDMWVLSTCDGNKVECGWILNGESHSCKIIYQCLVIRNEEVYD